jgi:hypothetical protein
VAVLALEPAKMREHMRATFFGGAQTLRDSWCCRAQDELPACPAAAALHLGTVTFNKLLRDT